MEILVLQSGWVVVGTPRRDGDTVFIDGARIIRRWGTAGGLGQLANEGPQRETVLEPACNVKTHPFGILLSFECNPAQWK